MVPDDEGGVSDDVAAHAVALGARVARPQQQVEVGYVGLTAVGPPVARRVPAWKNMSDIDMYLLSTKVAYW